MPKFSMHDLELLAGQVSGSDAYRNQDGSDAYHSPRLAPVHIRERIYEVMVAAPEPEQGMTRAEIARGLGLKKTPWLNQQIESLVADGYLVKYEAVSNKRSFMWLYALNPER